MNEYRQYPTPPPGSPLAIYMGTGTQQTSQQGQPTATQSNSNALVPDPNLGTVPFYGQNAQAQVSTPTQQHQPLQQTPNQAKFNNLIGLSPQRTSQSSSGGIGYTGPLPSTPVAPSGGHAGDVAGLMQLAIICCVLLYKGCESLYDRHKHSVGNVESQLTKNNSDIEKNSGNSEKLGKAKQEFQKYCTNFQERHPMNELRSDRETAKHDVIKYKKKLDSTKNENVRKIIEYKIRTKETKIKNIELAAEFIHGQKISDSITV